ncbi:transglutaminase domain-containing protein [Flavobacterium yafengii]|uniref:transglutaminase domain-containing protein n=1 Tax=Flavobacterium yafengii TaxID=3041253 RepID=UPI0024A86DE6|nr:transglutaminase domain-containing protein [Flavobacterium yafengii]MDI6045208.1 transglutaminase domain-containing protein [Flavobacterium yafengii]
MKNIYLVLFFFFSFMSFGQVNTGYSLVDAKMAVIPASSTTSTDAIAKYINSNFKTETDKIRAIFYWTASNISYDVANMFVINFNETEQEKIAKTLRTRKGVCIHYAVVFNELSQKIGIQSYIIDGYTKQNGKVSDLAHAWTAAKIDKKWYVFDPTWGSGYVNNGRFSKKINNYYFKAQPDKIIASHIPFDYLWQFSNYPITNNEFYEGKIQINKTKKYFDFEKEIIKYNALPEVDQLFTSAERIEKNGLKNAMILERYEGKKQQLTYLRQNTNIEKLNAIVNEMNQAVVLLNDFIHYRNNKFKPTFSDDEISSMIETPRAKLTKCQNDIYSVGAVGNKNASNVASIKASIRAALAQAEEHSLFVKKYLSASKIVRKTMFSKVSWFGVPLN